MEDEEEEIEEIEDSEPEDSEAEESELEEELEEETPPPHINLNNFDFGQLVDFESDAPVLERIAGEQTAGPRFVPMGGAAQGPVELQRESDENTYIPSGGNGDDTQYVESGNKIYGNPETVDILEVGRRNVNEFENFDQGAFIRSSERGFENTGVERVSMRPERVDMQRVGRQNPLEAEKENYKKYNLERKSY